RTCAGSSSPRRRMVSPVFLDPRGRSGSSPHHADTCHGRISRRSRRRSTEACSTCRRSYANFGSVIRRRPADTPGSSWPPSGGCAGKILARLGWSGLTDVWRLQTPPLVIAGVRDPIVPVINARILAGLLPEARLHVVRGGGHLFLIIQADETAHLVEEFLAGQ